MGNDMSGKASPSTTRSEAFRERIRRAQAVAADAARARAAGGPPSDEEAAQLVAAFHARGGKVTVLPLVESEQSDVEVEETIEG
ncbi:hypothetical protein [Paracraurococcus ruber]|uniref:hypothetical protein n=1 Tax=Paracraurococcus ruber TaxID=77675 RepID=UPI00105789B7|nr:hypothetical protein [Paracraurococcus ruber]TDG28904.1 hypothetical protein E2C05_19170 [Paracraurococcus ruber]